MKQLALQLRLPGHLSQSLLLYWSMLLMMALAFLSSVVAARLLGAAGYGDLKFVQTVWSLLSQVFCLGYLQSGSRLLLLEKDEWNARVLIGTILLIAALMAGALALFLFISAQVIDVLFHSQVASTLMILAPLGGSFTFQVALVLICQSTNRIKSLAVYYVVPQLLYLVSLTLLGRVTALTVTGALCLWQMTTVVVMAILVLPMRPVFRPTRRWLAAIAAEDKRYGWPNYVGSLAGVATAQLNRLAISYWVDTKSVGFYSLASALAQPLEWIPSTVGTSAFRSFAGQRRIPHRLLLTTIAVSLLSLLACELLFSLPLTFIFSREFDAVGPLARLAAIGALLYGFGAFFNRFLGAHGLGKVLRNTALLVGLANVAGLCILLPHWGVWGAVATFVLAGLIFMSSMLVSYMRFKAQDRIQPAPALLVEGP